MDLPGGPGAPVNYWASIHLFVCFGLALDFLFDTFIYIWILEYTTRRKLKKNCLKTRFYSTLRPSSCELILCSHGAYSQTNFQWNYSLNQFIHSNPGTFESPWVLHVMTRLSNAALTLSLWLLLRGSLCDMCRLITKLRFTDINIHYFTHMYYFSVTPILHFILPFLSFFRSNRKTWMFHSL